MLRVEREHAPWRDKFRAYKIVVDGETVGSVRDGASAEVPVDPGHHTLRLTIDWASSPMVEFDIAQGQRSTFRCRPSGGAASFWHAFLKPRSYIDISTP